MKERPILFSAPMVLARPGELKTQTRRIVKGSPNNVLWQPVVLSGYGGFVDGHGRPVRCPYGQPGDRLWVREAWRTVEDADSLAPRDLTPAHRIWHEADAPHQPGFGKLRPSMFMPRWASRIDLEVVAVRVERLQDISEADAVAEGCCALTLANPPTHESAKEVYSILWDQINGAGSWAANPWVWVVEFRRIRP